MERQRLTLDEVQLRLKQAQTSPELGEGQRANLLSLYSQAIQQVQLAEQCAAVGAQHDAQRRGAPVRLEWIRAQLELPPQPFASELPADSPSGQLEETLTQIQTELDRARTAYNELAKQRDHWLRRRLEIPGLITAARQRLTELAESPDGDAGTREASALALARQTLLQSRQMALETEVERYKQEMLNYTAQRAVLKTELELARLRVARLEQEIETWRHRVQERRRGEVEQALHETRELAQQAHAAVRKLAEEGLHLVQERAELNTRIRQTEERMRELGEKLAQLRFEREQIEKRVLAAELSGAAGESLRKDRSRLPDLRPHEQSQEQRKARTGKVRQRMSELEEQRATLSDEDRIVRTLRAALDPRMSQEEMSGVETEARQWVRRQQEQAEALLDEYGLYFDKLVHLDAREQELVDLARHLAAYVDARALWVRSSPVPSRADLGAAAEAVLWLGSPEAAVKLFRSARDSLNARAVGLLLALLLLMALRPRLRAALARSGESVARPGKGSILDSVKALMCTLLLAFTWPAAFFWAAWLLTPPGESPEVTRAIADGLVAAGAVLLTTQFVAQLVCAGGLAEKHFRWRAAGVRLLQVHLPWLTIVLVAAVFVFASLEVPTEVARKASLGRMAFIVACLALAVFAHRLLSPAAGAWSSLASAKPGGLVRVIHHGVRWTATAAALGLALAAALGYYSTALHLFWKVLPSVWCLLIVLTLSALLRRWLIHRMQRRALAEARQRAAQAAQQSNSGEAESGPVVTSEPAVDLAEIRAHTSRLARATLTVAAVLGLWMIWSDVLPALDVVRGVVLWTDHVETSETIILPDGSSSVTKLVKAIPVSLADLGLALIILILTFSASRNLPGMLEVTVLERLPLEPSSRYAIASVSRYLITLIGVILASSALGIGWSKVQWLAVALLVPLAFGLNDIITNYFAGLIILLERPVRVGDTVTVGDTSGIVTRIRMRATTITDWDRKELIVPNKRFITGDVLNWTLSDPTIRLALKVSVAHGSNPALVRDTLLRIAREHPHVASEPAPSAVFHGLGPSSMDFELSVFVRREDYGRVLHELNSAVEEALVATGISIAVPIHLQQIQVRGSGDRVQAAGAG